MPRIAPINAICYSAALDGSAPRDISTLISPPYDVLTDADKKSLLARDNRNITAIDLPHTPPSAAGPDAVYRNAGERLRAWLAQGVLRRLEIPVYLVYEQAFEFGGRPHVRRGLMANLPVQNLGAASDDAGGIYPHEQTFPGPKEDRLKLMRATGCQLSPIFGMYSDSANEVGKALGARTAAEPAFLGTTRDGVTHRVWLVDDPALQRTLAVSMLGKDVFIADGHHRYATAIQYRQDLAAAGGNTDGADWCTFVLVAVQDPGMVVLPTHRVAACLADFNMEKFCQAAKGKLRVSRFASASLRELEDALPTAGPHAMGLYDATEPDPHRRLWIAVTLDDDPLATVCPDRSAAWRQLDVAIAQHLVIDRVCQRAFADAAGQLPLGFPHTLKEFQELVAGERAQLGLLMQPTPLQAVLAVCEEGELMPQKSTFFYPKLATGLAINALG